MINRIKDLLRINNKVDGYLINAREVKSKELFFIRDKMEMNRAKDVEHYDLTVYKDFEEEGTKYKGSATVLISPTMSAVEIAKIIDGAIYAASFVKNPYYELVEDASDRMPKLRSSRVEVSNDGILTDIVKAVYSCDEPSNGNINSTEIFIETTSKRIVNSEGIDREYTSSKLHMSIIVEYAHEDEEIELIEIFNIHHFDKRKMKQKIRELFNNAKNRAHAKSEELPTGIPIILRDDSVREMLTYYEAQTSVDAIYNKRSSIQAGDMIQGENIKGDKINMVLTPEIEESIYSSHIDDDGVLLNEVKLIKDGQVASIHGSSRYSQYLNVRPTGIIKNVVVDGGSISYKDMIKEDCLEVISFSDFQIDDVTGDFGGEVRLAIYHQNGYEIPLTGGSITGKIKDIQENMYFSTEIDMFDNFYCPKAIKYTNTEE